MNFPLTTTGRCPQMHRLHTAQAPQVCEGWISQQVRRLLVQDRLSCVISWACSRDIAKHAKPTWTNRNWKLAFIYPWGKYSLQFKVCRIVDIFSIYLGIHVKGTFLDERIWSNITRMCFFWITFVLAQPAWVSRNWLDMYHVANIQNVFSTNAVYPLVN